MEQIEIDVAKSEGSTWNFVKGAIAYKALIDEIFDKYKYPVIVNIAAQTGVRYSIINPGGIY